MVTLIQASTCHFWKIFVSRACSKASFIFNPRENELELPGILTQQWRESEIESTEVTDIIRLLWKF